MQSKRKKPLVNPYWISLPERSLRAMAAALGGLVFEAANVLLPGWLRSSRLYQATVHRLLRITVELIGGARGLLPEEPLDVGELAARKAAGNVIELAGFLSFGWSPLWFLAAAADLTSGTRLYLHTLVSELQREGLLPQETDISSVEDLLKAMEGSSGAMADLVDVPPLKVAEIRESWHMMRQNAASLPDAAQLRRIFDQLQSVARQEQRSLWEVSGLLGAGALRAGLKLGQVYLFDYYKHALGEIGREGFVTYLKRVSRPYLWAAGRHFDPLSETYTERAFRKLPLKKS